MNTNRWQDTTGPGMPAIEASLNGIIPGVVATELYKQNVGGAEEGSLAASYSTLIAAELSAGDGASAATITYGAGNLVGPTAYMLVKDGNHNPIWYFYNLSALGWNGTETLNLSGFWANTGGAISHVTLYGTSTSPGTPRTTSVPDGGTTLLSFGIALLGLGSMRKLIGSKAKA